RLLGGGGSPWCSCGASSGGCRRPLSRRGARVAPGRSRVDTPGSAPGHAPGISRGRRGRGGAMVWLMSTVDFNSEVHDPAAWTHLQLDRRGDAYWRVTFDHPPINTVTATTVAELAQLVDLIEAHSELNVVVFDSAN